MTQWVALLRGMNLGGNRMPMADLRALCEGLGWCDVRSYIASGNLVFRATGTGAGLAQALRAAMRAAGLDVPVLVLDAPAFRAMLAHCPFPGAAGTAVHGVICWQDPVIDRARLSALIADTETLTVQGRTVWLHTPGGFGTSALAGKLAQVVTGTETTARNLNTLRALAEMLDSAD